MIYYSVTYSVKENGNNPTRDDFKVGETAGLQRPKDEYFQFDDVDVYRTWFDSKEDVEKFILTEIEAWR